MSCTNFLWDASKTLVTYDLSNNAVSAQEIANSSNGQLFTKIDIDGIIYDLPNTTLVYNGDKNNAKNVFVSAFNKANPSPFCSISRLLVTEVDKMLIYIEN